MPILPKLLSELRPEELNWNYDFFPQKHWPSILPVLAVVHENRPTVIGGFDKKNEKNISVLIVDGAIESVMEDLYDSKKLLLLESLRFNKLFGKSIESLDYCLALPLALQIFLDEKQVPLKVLKPLEYLKDWSKEITAHFLSLKPSSSQVREILDLLCDLKMKNINWQECAPKAKESAKWISDLFKLRNPNLSRSDLSSAQIIENAPWPRGVRAKWERQGDQGGITIQARVVNPREFQTLKNSLSKVEIEDKLWTP